MPAESATAVEPAPLGQGGARLGRRGIGVSRRPGENPVQASLRIGRCHPPKLLQQATRGGCGMAYEDNSRGGSCALTIARTPRPT